MQPQNCGVNTCEVVQLHSVQEISSIWFLQLLSLAEILKHSPGNDGGLYTQVPGVTKNCSRMKISYRPCFDGEYM